MTPRVIVDAHTHVWDLDAAPYPWITPELSILNRTFELAELEPELDACSVGSVVLVQAADNDEDTDHMLRVAAAKPRVAGVVAWVPLDRPDAVAARLHHLAAVAGIVGVRALIHAMPDEDWIVRDDVGEGLDEVARAGLTFDFVSASPSTLRHVPTLSRRHPDLKIIIDHLGKPPVGGTDENLALWRALLADCASSPNVAAKISGLHSAVGSPDSWSVATLRPVIDTALEVFGADRLMYGGDWPLALLAGGYTRCFDGVWEALSDLAESDLDAIYAGTATHWYGLNATKGTS